MTKLKDYGFELNLVNNRENYKIILNNIVLLLIKINESIITDLTNLSANNKCVNILEDSKIIVNNLTINENNYFDDFDFDKNLENRNKKNLDINNVNNNNIYFNIIEIYEQCFPLILQFYTNKENRPIKKITSTYKNCDYEILGIMNLSIIELFNTFFEILVLNSKNKIFGYNLHQNDFDYIENTFKEKIDNLFNILKRENFFKICLEDLLKYEMNNSFQILFKNIITNILDFTTNELNNIKFENVDSNKILNNLLNQIFIDNDFIKFIIDKSLINETQFENTKKHVNSGYLPFLIDISDKINNISSHNNLIEKMLEKRKNLKNFFTFF